MDLCGTGESNPELVYARQVLYQLRQEFSRKGPPGTPKFWQWAGHLISSSTYRRVPKLSDGVTRICNQDTLANGTTRQWAKAGTESSGCDICGEPAICEGRGLMFSLRHPKTAFHHTCLQPAVREDISEQARCSVTFMRLIMMTVFL